MRQQRHQRKQWQSWIKPTTTIQRQGQLSQKEEGGESTMTRNDDKYFYVRDVAFERGSLVLDEFLKDLADSSMTRSPGQFLVVRLGDYYRDKRLIQIAATTAPAQVSGSTVPPSSSLAENTTATIASSRRGKGKKALAPPVEEALTEDDFADVYDM